MRVLTEEGWRWNRRARTGGINLASPCFDGGLPDLFVFLAETSETMISPESVRAPLRQTPRRDARNCGTYRSWRRPATAARHRRFAPDVPPVAPHHSYLRRAIHPHRSHSGPHLSAVHRARSTLRRGRIAPQPD